MKLLIAFAVVLGTVLISARSFASSKTTRMDASMMEFLMQTLHGSKAHPNLLCEVKVREIQQDRKFSDRTERVDMIELEFSNGYGFNGTPMKTYFPIGSTVTRKTVNSEFSGPVEEIEIESDDRLNKTFTFQHDGRGQIVWMMMHDELRVNPCQLRKR